MGWGAYEAGTVARLSLIDLIAALCLTAGIMTSPGAWLVPDVSPSYCCSQTCVIGRVVSGEITQRGTDEGPRSMEAKRETATQDGVGGWVSGWVLLVFW